MAAIKTKRRNTLRNAFNRSVREWLYMKTKNMAKTYTRRDKVLLKSDYYDNQAWGALIKCWKGFEIAKSQEDEEKMIYYAEGIQKFQCELGKDIEDFSHLGLCSPSSSPREAIEEQDEANDCATYDDAPNTNDKAKGDEYEFDSYEDYVSSLPMGIEPISKDEFYKGHK
jgi:hypothetical protein